MTDTKTKTQILQEEILRLSQKIESPTFPLL